MTNSWKTAWITGASSGIGFELARLLDGSVGHVAVSARSRDKLEALAKDSGTIAAYPLDVTNAEAVRACVKKIESRGG
ncbi:MAG: SDR family NAD(P)-dependent oxidoreductase, partial [Burkholderiales bacterium]|nr:SDR family NAD(P)-dependent oxidoreductase [Burkholderiales bacterium]